MSEQNVDVVKRFMAAVDRQDWQGVRNSLASEFEMQFPGCPSLDKEGFVQFCVDWYAAFPDLVHDIEETLTDGDRVVLRLTVHGTQRGDFMGIPTSGKYMSIDSVGMGRVRDGKVTRLFALRNMLAMMQQLGAIPTPASV